VNWVGGHVNVHLGARVSDLLDGQMSAAAEERAWDHVHRCHPCRDLVEREGWVKTRLAGLAFGATEVPAYLRSALLDPPTHVPGGLPLVPDGPRARRVGLAVLGSGAAGAAVMGVLALGAAPAQVPTIEPRPPASVNNSPVSPVVVGTNRRDLGR
jgi:hypothetical protein